MTRGSRPAAVPVNDAVSEEELLRIAIEESKDTTPNTENMTYE